MELPSSDNPPADCRGIRYLQAAGACGPAGAPAQLQRFHHRRYQLAPLRDRPSHGNLRIYRGAGDPPATARRSRARWACRCFRSAAATRRWAGASPARRRAAWRRARSRTAASRDIELTLRWMDAMGVDYRAASFRRRCSSSACIRRSRSRWRWRGPITAGCATACCAHEPRIRSMLYLPFNDPEACYKMVKEFGDKQGRRRLHASPASRYKRGARQRLHEDLRADRGAGMPLAFHAGYNWGDDAYMELMQPLHRGPRAGLRRSTTWCI